MSCHCWHVANRQAKSAKIISQTYPRGPSPIGVYYPSIRRQKSLAKWIQARKAKSPRGELGRNQPLQSSITCLASDLASTYAIGCQASSRCTASPNRRGHLVDCQNFFAALL